MQLLELVCLRLILGHLDLVSGGKDDFEGEDSPGVTRIDSGVYVD